MEGFVLLTLSSALLGLIIWWIIRLTRAPSNRIPSKPGWPIIGNITQMRLERPELLYMDWAKELGPVFSVKIFGLNFVVLNDYESIYEVLVKKRSAFSARPQNNGFRIQYTTGNYSGILFSYPDDRWKKIRKISHKNIKTYDSGLKQIEDINTGLAKAVVEAFRAQNGQSFDAFDILYNSLLNVLTVLLSSKVYESSDPEVTWFHEVEEAVKLHCGPMGSGLLLDLFPWLRFFGNYTYKRLTNVVERWNMLWESLKVEAMKGSRDNLISELMSLVDDESSTQPPTREINVKYAVQELITGGVVTSANTLYAFLNVICNHPEILTRLQKELDEHVGRDRSVTHADKSHLPFARACVLEMLRYSSVLPLSVPRMSIEESTIGDWHVPSGTTVLPNLWALHHDEAFWGDPYAFRPDRFLDESGQLVPASDKQRLRLMPFGAGARVCVGEVMALSRLFLITCALAQNFDIRPGDQGYSCDPRLYQQGFVLRQKTFEMRAIPRD